MRYVYDKDLCRIIPLQYKHTVYKDGNALLLFQVADSSTANCDDYVHFHHVSLHFD